MKSKSGRALRGASALKRANALPLTTSRPELLINGTDRDFRKLVHNIFAFMARHESIRDGHARFIGLAGIEYTILISIGHLGLDGDVNIKTVADHLHMSGAFVTTVTRKLQIMGLIRKTQDEVDRRRISLVITDAGRKLLLRLAPYQREINDIEFGSLSREEFEAFSSLIEDMTEASDKAVAWQHYKESLKGKIA